MESTVTRDASQTKHSVEFKTESAHHSDTESMDDSFASSDDQQQSRSRTKLSKNTDTVDFTANASQFDDDEDDDLLLKKIGKTQKHLSLEENDMAVAIPAESQVLI